MHEIEEAIRVNYRWSDLFVKNRHERFRELSAYIWWTRHVCRSIKDMTPMLQMTVPNKVLLGCDANASLVCLLLDSTSVFSDGREKAAVRYWPHDVGCWISPMHSCWLFSSPLRERVNKELHGFGMISISNIIERMIDKNNNEFR